MKILGIMMVAAAIAVGQVDRDVNGRRVVEGEPAPLAFKNVTVEDLIPFISEATGKAVMPQQDIMSRRITVINDSPIPREEALDFIFIALVQNGVAIVEHANRITLRDISEVNRQDVPIIGPDVSVLDRKDLGTIAEKVFALSSSTAETLAELLEDSVPDYASLTADEESNQITILGTIALLQRMEHLINALDRSSVAALRTQTFTMRYADAEAIKTNIEELFSADAGNAQNNNGRGQFNFRNFQRGGRDDNDEENASTSEDLRVTANSQQNSVTVLAEPGVLDQIRTLIATEWDRPLAKEDVVPKVYELQNSDPIKVRDVLEGLFGEGTTGGGGGQQSTQGVGRLAGMFSFQAIPEAGRLIVIAKSPDNLTVIDEIIDELDRENRVALPAVVELDHASAEELAEQINTLLAEAGTLAQIPRTEEGLSESSATSSPFASDTGQDTQQDTVDPGTIQFWWQRSRPPTDELGPSNLIGRIRIVPVWRQNALLVLAPPEYRNSVVDLIEDLDRPGRQVLISAVVAEVSRDDATALGLRWSSQTINPTSADNSFSIGASSTNSQDDFLGSLFNTSVLDVNANLNVILQALNEKTDVNILSEPKIFTSDNQEAEFFDGQDIPFVTDSQTTDNGNLITSTDYRAVGIQLRARPRITPNRHVDLRVNLELSAIAPGVTLNGGFIVDRRETTTQLIVRDGQTIVISGIIRSEESDIVRKVPLLGDIPLLGAIFRSQEKTIANTELLVFITPVVVENTDEADDLNAEQRERLQQLRDQMESGGGKALDATTDEDDEGANG